MDVRPCERVKFLHFGAQTWPTATRALLRIPGMLALTSLVVLDKWNAERVYVGMWSVNRQVSLVADSVLHAVIKPMPERRNYASHSRILTMLCALAMQCVCDPRVQRVPMLQNLIQHRIV